MEPLLPLRAGPSSITSASSVRPLSRSLSPLHRARRELRPCCPPPSIFLSFPRWISQAACRARQLGDGPGAREVRILPRWRLRQSGVIGRCAIEASLRTAGRLIGPASSHWGALPRASVSCASRPGASTAPTSRSRAPLHDWRARVVRWAGWKKATTAYEFVKGVKGADAR